MLGIIILIKINLFESEIVFASIVFFFFSYFEVVTLNLLIFNIYIHSPCKIMYEFYNSVLPIKTNFDLNQP